MKILLIVSGGIAAYKSLLLLRLYKRAGHDVQVVMTESAKSFIQPLSFQALSGSPVRDSLFDSEQEAGMDHIALARWPDVIVMAPATANRIAKTVQGIADDLASTLILATDKPILFAPAMNRLMWQNSITQKNVDHLHQQGFHILKPDSGEQACGEVGAGRLPDPDVIFEATLKLAANPMDDFWSQQSILITAGPTFENIDPVRFIGNRSSGKMGFEIARAARALGAKVTLISGPVHLTESKGIERIDVRSAEEMLSAVQSHYRQHSMFIGAAAVADYRCAEVSDHKMKKVTGEETVQLTLVKNPDIIAWVASQEDRPYVVGFAAETQNLIAYAHDKLVRKNLDMICANQVGAELGFEQYDNQLTLITAEEQLELPRSSKSEQAQRLLEFIKQQF
jgi:phosphopantothenoylcysteine decarboxylase/phosphopantothenate--cysteine ligase